ncbi:MAG: acetyl-CoA carboxylase biotin carboxyl carrier protein [Vicinamibacterales bacterium]
MTLDEIKALIEFIREHDLHEFELEQDGVKLRVKSASTPPMSMPAMPPVMMAPPMAPQPAAAPGGAAPPPPAAADEGTELAIVKSPIVGTFYRSPEPGAKSFVESGDSVKKGQVLCIIEAMKLMNEIDSEYDGEIVSVYVENGQPVQYGERLFAIRLRS